MVFALHKHVIVRVSPKATTEKLGNLLITPLVRFLENF